MAVIVALIIRAVRKREAERQKIPGDVAQGVIGAEFKGLLAVLSAHPSVCIQPVTRIVGGPATFRDHITSIGNSKMITHAVPAHGPTEPGAELRQVKWFQGHVQRGSRGE